MVVKVFPGLCPYPSPGQMAWHPSRRVAFFPGSDAAEELATLSVAVHGQDVSHGRWRNVAKCPNWGPDDIPACWDQRWRIVYFYRRKLLPMIAGT